MSTRATIAQNTRTIALVGASDKPDRASNRVMQFLLARGYVVHPVNPVLAGHHIHGQRVYAVLADVPAPVDMVDIFRNTDAAADVIDEAIALRETLSIQTIWCQPGVTPHDAAKRAEAAGMQVVMDKCPAIEWS